MRKFLILTLSWFLLVSWTVIGAEAASDKKIPPVGPVKINAHPADLQGKTVVLRWNGKMNGDKFLTRFGELLAGQVKNVKIVKMWEVDKTTVSVSRNLEESLAVAKKIAAQKPALVIASQAD